MLDDAVEEGSRSKKADQLVNHWFWGGIIACKKTYLQVISASVLINLFALASSLYIMTVYDRVIPNQAMESLWALTFIMGVILVFDFIMKMIRSIFIDYASARIDRSVSDRLFDKILHREVFLDRRSTGSLASVVREFDFLKEMIGSASFTVFADAPFIILFIIVLFSIGGMVAVIPALIVPVVIIFGLFLQPLIKRLSKDNLEQGQNKQSVMVEMIGAIKTLKTVRGIDTLHRRWMKSVATQSAISHKGKYASQLVQTFTQSGQQFSQIGIIVYGVYLISAGDLTMGQLIACVILSGRTLAPLGQITNLLGKLNQGAAAYNNLDKILSAETEEEKRLDQVKREKVAGSISLKNLTFTYPGQAEPALNDISLEIKAGERVAILGKVGSGKTTLLEVLAGIYEQSSGFVMIDNTDIRQFRHEDMRRNMAVVLQNPILFSGTIRENILMGNPDATDQELIEASAASGAHNFLGTLQGGFDFKLSERGKELSAGMQQTLAIARGLIAKPSIFLMDEPTSSLDSGGEQYIVQSLDKNTKGKTCVFVTHRGALLHLVDRVIIMERGRVIADGPRDEILKPQTAS